MRDPYPAKPIAAYCFLMSCYYYWDAQMQDYCLMEVAPGNLVQVDQTPIPFQRLNQLT